MAVNQEAIDIILRLQGVPTYRAGMQEAAAANKEYEASVVKAKKATDESAASQEKQRAAATLASKAMKVTAVGLAAAAFESVKAAVKWSDMSKTISQETGLTGASLDSLMGTIKATAAHAPYSIGEIAEAAVLLKTKFGESDAQVEKSSALMVAFAKRVGGATKDVTTSLLSTLQQFREPLGSVTVLTDKLTSVAQATQKPMSDLLGVVERYGPKLQAMGFGLNETIRLLGVFQASGISTAMMGRGLSQGLTVAEKEHKETNVPIPNIIQRHMQEIAKAKNQQEAFSLSMEYFGKQVGPSFARALYDNARAFDTVDTAMKKTGSTQALLEAQQKEASGRWQELRNRLTILGITAGEQLVPVLLSLGKVLLTVTAAIMSVTGNGKALAITVMALVGAWALYKAVMIASKIATAAWAVTTTVADGIAAGAEIAIYGMAAAFDGLDVAMDANPIGLIILAIAALVAAVAAATYFIVTHFSQTLNFLKHWGFILAAILFGPFVGLVVFVATHWSLVKGILNAGIHWIETAWPKVEKVLTWPFEELWKVAQSVFKEIENLWKKIPGHGLVEGAIKGIGSAAKALGFAEGGVMPYTGWATVNENVPGETVWLPGGASVQPSPATSLAVPRPHTPTPAPAGEGGRPIYIEAYLELPHSGSRGLYKLITKQAAIKAARI